MNIAITAAKKSIIDIPVTISGFIIGTLVTDVMEVLRILLLILYIPSAAAVPITVARRAERIARTRVLRRAVNASGDEKSSAYHFKVKPVNTEVLSDLLKEKSISVSIGIYSIANMIPR